MKFDCCVVVRPIHFVISDMANSMTHICTSTVFESLLIVTTDFETFEVPKEPSKKTLFIRFQS